MIDGDYGLLSASGEELTGPVAYPAMAGSRGHIHTQSVEWSQFILPTEDQGRLGSCVGHATANFVEAMIRKYCGMDSFAKGEQIDAVAIYKRGREMFWSADEAGEGLYVEQGLKAAIDMGVIPPDARVETFGNDTVEASKNILRAPLVCGQRIHNNWYNAQGNGNIPDGHAWMGGHAVLLFGFTSNSHGEFGMILNSWGRSWGWSGIGVLPVQMLERDAMHTAYAAAYAPAQSWAEWQGWRDYIKKA